MPPRPRRPRSPRPRKREVTLQWIKPARQDRSRDMQDRLIDAAGRLLQRGRSWDEVTVADLAKEAEASVGAFYSRFRDKAALLHVLQLELVREGEATTAQAAALAADPAIPLASLARAFVALAISSYRQQAGLRRALILQMSGDDQFRQRAIELSRLTAVGLATVLAARFPRQPRATVRTVADVCHRMVYGVLDQRLMFSDRPTGHPLDDRALTEELARALLAYVEDRLGEPRPARG